MREGKLKIEVGGFPLLNYCMLSSAAERQNGRITTHSLASRNLVTLKMKMPDLVVPVTFHGETIHSRTFHSSPLLAFHTYGFMRHD